MDHMERRQNEELMEARRLRRQEQKRKLLMRQRVLAAVLLVIFVLSLILILRGCRNRREHPELYAKKDTTLQLETEPDTTVTISAVGDIMITDELLADAKQPDGSYNFAESFAAVSGYTLEDVPPESANGGYKDWFIQRFRRPGFTIEAGLGENPLPLSQLEQLCGENERLLALAMQE